MICNDAKAVFVHIPKTAGQSIERVFARRRGLTWSTRSNLLLKRNADPSAGPPRLAHLLARDYVGLGYLSHEEFERFFKFTFVRNPWARAVSMYRYLGYVKFLSFRTFVEKELSGSLWKKRFWFVRPQSDFICDASGAVLVDYIGRYERLQADFEVVCERLALPPMPIPHANKTRDAGPPLPVSARLRVQLHRMLRSHFPQFPDYEQYYDSATRRMVGSLYGADVERFQYDFGKCAAEKRQIDQR